MRRFFAPVLTVLSLTACSSPNSKQLARDVVAAMGGTEKLQGVQTIVMKGGTGSRTRLGQTVHVNDIESSGMLQNVVETLDLANGRASMDYELSNGGFNQHRHEVLTKHGAGNAVGIDYVGTRPVIATSPGGLFSWGTQNSPVFLLKRNVITIALAAAGSASDSEAVSDKPFDGRMANYGTAQTKEGQEVGLYVDPQSKLLAGFEVVDTETILGDVPAQYILSDYRAVNGLTLPHHITIRKGGRDYSDVQYTSIAVNDLAAQQVFAIPDAAVKEADEAVAAGQYSPLSIVKVADGLYFGRAYSHNSMIVEFPNWLAVVEAPYTETQTLTLARLLRMQFPNKPIKYAAVTHHHYDHTGGVRAIAALGATVLVAKGHEAPLRELLEARHTHPQDELDRRRTSQPAQATGSIELYDGKKVIVDGKQSLELYPISGSPHADPIVLAYVPSARALFQSDLFFPGTGAPANPAAVHLLESVRKLNLKVETNVGGHGGVAPFAELVKAAGTARGNAN